jgi:hypothetical protein
MKPKKLMITEKIGELGFWSDLSGSFDQVIDNLKICKDVYPKNHPLQSGEEIYLDYNPGNNWDDEASLDIILKRYENDKEYNKRIKEIEKEKTFKKHSKASLQNKELKEYKRLKKKYGQ